MMISGAFTLREAERSAKKERLSMWHDYTPPVGSSTKQAGKFKGRVAEVASGDVLVVQDAASGAERRITISSIRAPRAGRRDEKGEPYGHEAKEFLRSRLIGEIPTPMINRNCCQELCIAGTWLSSILACRNCRPTKLTIYMVGLPPAIHNKYRECVRCRQGGHVLHGVRAEGWRRIGGGSRSRRGGAT